MRNFAVIALLALLAAASGCATGSGRVQKQPVAAVAPPAAAPVASSRAGLLVAAEAPTIDGATKFADAPDVDPEESQQVRSMREQMTRRYGRCCGK